MSAKRLIHELSSSAWLIEPNRAQAFIPSYFNLLTGKSPENIISVVEISGQDGEPIKASSIPFAIAHAEVGNIVAANITPLSSASQNSIAVIPVQGPIMKNDSCGDPGTMTMAKWVNEAAANPNISSIVLNIDSPGGTVSGTQTLADAITAAKAVKPVIAHVNEGLMASAAYWIGSSATEINASQNTDMIGSIGVYTTMVDVYSYFRAQGYKVEDVYSNLSTDKNASYRAWLDGNSDPLKTELDFIAQQFQNAVKQNRAGKLNFSVGNPLNGATYYAPDALKIGLIDSIGSFESALNRAVELSSQQNQSMKKSFLKASWAAVAMLFGANLSSLEENPVELTDEHWEKANATLAENANQITALTSQLDAEKKTSAAAQETIASLTKERDELKETVATYGKKPGDVSTTAEKPNGDDQEETVKLNYEAPANL